MLEPEKKGKIPGGRMVIPGEGVCSRPSDLGFGSDVDPDILVTESGAQSFWNLRDTLPRGRKRWGSLMTTMVTRPTP
jgi:hypothetical protein